jgi:hypothetical protein
MTMNTSQLPYIEFGPHETSPPPFAAGGGDFLGLILKGDAEKLQKLCDTALNDPFASAPQVSPCTYQPFGDAVLLFAGRWEGMLSTTLVDAGTADEEQLSLWVPVKEVNKQTGEIERVCMFVPFMFVNNPISLLNGREDYGYPKSFGYFHPECWDRSAPLTMKAFGGQLGKTNVAKWSELVSLTPTSPKSGAGREAPQSGAPSPEVFPAEILRDMLVNGTTQVFLKQFRDAETARMACYRRLVEAPVRFKKWEVQLHPTQWRFDVDAPEPNVHPIPGELGIEAVETPFAFELKSELELDAGKIIV